LKQLIQLQKESHEGEKDGIAALIMDWDNNVEILRNFIDYDGILEETYARLNSAKLVVLHTRTGTSGSKSLTNVHLFESDNYVLAHNGFVLAQTSYGTYQGSDWDKKGLIPIKSEKVLAAESVVSTCSTCGFWKNTKWDSYKKCKFHKEQIDALSEYAKQCRQLGVNDEKKEASDSCCDSFLFLKSLTKPEISTQYLFSEMTKQRFTGMAFLMNKETKDSYLLVRNKEAACSVSDDKTFSMFFSYEPELKASYPTYKTLNGIAVIEGEEDIEIDLESKKIIQGVHKIDLENIDSPENDIVSQGIAKEEPEIIYPSTDDIDVPRGA